jgi:hypothetical protein
MDERRLGGLEVSALGYGAMGLAGMYGQPTAQPKARAANPAVVELLGGGRGEEGRHARTGRARVAAPPGAVDRADPRHHQAAPPRREPGAVNVAFTRDDLRAIDEATAKITVQGARLPPEAVLKFSNR